MESTEKKTILVAPLDWGLGHASRCIPIIRHFVQTGHNVLLAGNGRSAELLRIEFPLLPLFTDIPDYAITYPENENFTIHFIKNSFRLLKIIRDEQQWLNHFLNQQKVDWVISDNRYGLHNPAVKTFFITHQLHIPAPGYLRALTNFINRSFIHRFNLCLVPDFAGEQNLSGALSHGKHNYNNLRYIGPLSRFGEFKGIPDHDILAHEPRQIHNLHSPQYQYEFTILISGPEPARTHFRALVVKLFAQSNKPCIMIEGKTEKKETEVIGNLTIAPHLPESEFREKLLSSRYIICRSGYSTIMDLYYLGKKALLVPTPGQPEQLYLARLHNMPDDHAELEQQKLAASSLDDLLHIITKR